MLNLGIQLCNCYASIHFSFVCESTWPFVELFTISIPICDQIHGQTCLGLWAMKLAGIFKANMAILDLIFLKIWQKLSSSVGNQKCRHEERPLWLD